jgi:hypothetical protein
MMLPPPAARNCGIAYLQVRNAPVRLTASASCQSASQVQRPERGRRALDGRVHGGRVAHVAGAGDGATPRATDTVRHRRGVVRRDVGAQHIRALGRERLGDGATDAVAGAGYDGTATHELAHRPALPDLPG